MSAISQATTSAATYRAGGSSSPTGRPAGGAVATNGDADADTDGNPSTPLKSVKGKNGFMFPAIWSFPPFFTPQPNPTTQAHQVDLWVKLILDWARAERVWTVHVDAGAGDLGEVFENRQIRRRLMPASIRIVLAAMVKDGRAAPDPPKQSDSYFIYWKKPEEWGMEVYEWVMGNGMGGSILTFWEITEGELTEGTGEFKSVWWIGSMAWGSEGQGGTAAGGISDVSALKELMAEFYGMPPSLLRRSIETLVKRGKAQIIKGEGEAGEGVRFF